MKLNKSSYRNPDNSITHDVDEYITAWKTLAEKVLKFFPGYIIGSFNPGIILTRWEKQLDGRSRAIDTVRLSVMACNCLVSGKEPERVTREDF
jgi:hypothetical protein